MILLLLLVVDIVGSAVDIAVDVAVVIYSFSFNVAVHENHPVTTKAISHYDS